MNVYRIREARKSAQITLKELAEQVGYTVSYLSQIERGLKMPSLGAMRKIAHALGIELITLLVDEDEKTDQCQEHQYHVIQKNKRTKVDLPTMKRKQEMFTPTTSELGCSPKLQGLVLSMEPGEMASEKQIAHDRDEIIFVRQGKLKTVIQDEEVELQQGDSIYIVGGQPHNFFSVGEELTELILIMV